MAYSGVTITSFPVRQLPVADLWQSVPVVPAFMGEIKKANNAVVPAKGFLVTESGNQPWYMRPEVNLDNLDILANKLE